MANISQEVNSAELDGNSGQAELSKIDRIRLDMDIQDAAHEVDTKKAELALAETALAALITKRRSIYGR